MKKTPEFHGESNTPLYKKWRTMRLRINYPETNGYENYGGRGIKICDRWAKYSAFKEDMGPSFEVGMTLDRIDPDGDYVPENCRWVTPLEQQRSKRKHLIFEGKFLVDWARDAGINYSTASKRFKKFGNPLGSANMNEVNV